MACNCFRRSASAYDAARAEACKLSQVENADYVIYTYEGKIYTDRKECWENAGCLGSLRELICRI